MDLVKVTAGLDLTNPIAIRRKICELECQLHRAAAEGTFEPQGFPLRHRFGPHVYERTILLPAGTVIVGKLHRHAHFNYLMHGEVTMLTEHGGLERIRGPVSMLSPAGTKRALYCHTPVMWITAHPTDSTDLAEIERQTIAASYTELGLEDPMIEILALEGEAA